MMNPHFPYSTKHISSSKLKTIRRRLSMLYGVEQADPLLERLYLMIGRYGVGPQTSQTVKGISHRDAVLITYADIVKSPEVNPLVTL